MAYPDPWAVRPPTAERLHRRRRALQAATSLLLVIAPFIGVFRFDVAGGGIILAGRSFGLSELGPIVLLLLLGLLLVFVGALLYGRLWCGWMCPQTTLSELASAIDRRLRRRRPRDRGAHLLSAVLIVVVGACVAASLVSYFLTPADLLAPSRAAQVAFAACAAILAVDLLWVRHRFCLDLCPYGILLGIVADQRTLRVRLDDPMPERCAKCRTCVRACFVGVDIRHEPFNMHCLSCGDCIDTSAACYRKQRLTVPGFCFGLEPTRWPGWLARFGILDVRRAVIASATLLVAVASAVCLWARPSLAARVAPRFDQLTVRADGSVRNSYDLTLHNQLRRPVRMHLEARGIPGLSVVSPTADIALNAGERTHVALVLEISGQAQPAGACKIFIRLRSEAPGTATELSTRFFVPERPSS